MTGGYAAGIVYFGEDSELSTCLDSLKRQSCAPRSIIVIDHNMGLSEGGEALRRQHADVEWISQPNTGYAGGGNAILDRALQVQPSPAAVLILNPDIELAPDFAERLLRAMGNHPEVALASGKLLRPGRKQIDSAGIIKDRTRRFRDRGSGALDTGQFEEEEVVFAVSGAALMLRVASLPGLTVLGEVFDEDFFCYHEDTDLAWRAGGLGYSSLYVPSAQATHGRGWRREGRGQVSPAIRRHSFKNRYLEMIKNDRASDLLRDLPLIFGMEFARLAFALFRDREVLPGYVDAARGARRAFDKRRSIQRMQVEQRVRARASYDFGKAGRSGDGTIGKD